MTTNKANNQKWLIHLKTIEVMRQLFLLVTFSLLGYNSFSQVKMEITLNNGDIKKGDYELNDNKLGWATKTKIISKKTKEKYALRDISSLIMYMEDEVIQYEVIRVKKYFDSQNEELKLGQVGLKGNHIELFYVSEYIYHGGAMTNTTAITTTASSSNEKYLRKKDDIYAYNMGYLYGAGQRGIKKRIRYFFTDCPVLVDKIDNNEIQKKETMDIALFYENNCKK